jgi:hypothetical protein
MLPAPSIAWNDEATSHARGSSSAGAEVAVAAVLVETDE